jgi:diguanylate cyclase (GGDEF)-like protein
MKGGGEQDPLTRIVGEDALYAQFAHALADSREQGTSLSILLLDLCGLRMANEVGGHRVGDQIVLELAKLLHDEVEDPVVIGRIAGSEFLVVLKGCRSDVLFLGQRLQSKVGLFQLDVPPDRFARVSLSFGVAEFGVNGEELEDLLRVATMETLGVWSRQASTLNDVTTTPFQ